MDLGVFLKTTEAVNNAMKMINTSLDGHITHEQFTAFARTSTYQSLNLDDRILSQREALAKIFRKYDTDEGGTLTYAQFAGAICTAISLSPHSTSAAVVQQ